MIGLDTNILIQFLTQDDLKQSQIVNKIKAKNCEYTITFDKEVSKLDSFKLLKSSKKT